MVAAERGECEVKRGISQLMFLKGGDTRGAWVCRNDLCCWLDFFRIMADGYEERPLQGGVELGPVRPVERDRGT